MGHRENILVIGRHADMLARVTDLLKSHNYVPFGALTNEEAFHTFGENPIQAVLIGGGVDGESRALFHREFVKINPAVKVLDAHPHTVLGDLQAAFPD